ncbi:NIPA-like protein 3 [Mortierella alpina]|nr:NIPA-like protein 3 [Mortierella alpina]
MSPSNRGFMGIRYLLLIAGLALVMVCNQSVTAVPAPGRLASSAETSPRTFLVSDLKDTTTPRPPPRNSHLRKRDTPAGMPLTCRNDFQCQQTTRPPNWPREHDTVRSGNYACVFASSGSSTGTCQFVVTAGEQCNVQADCAAFAFYTRFNLTTPRDLCSPSHCTLESTCGSPWQNSNAPSNHSYSKTNDGRISCCGGLPERSVCSLVGANVDSCEYHNVCKFDFDSTLPRDPMDTNGYTPEQMVQLGLGFCQKIDQRNHVWIGVIITLISSTVLNLGLNGQKYALRKHDEQRVQKELEHEEEYDVWRRERGWTEEEVQAEIDRLYEKKENSRGKLYRRLKPYMFWRAIFVSKLWAAGLLVFIIGNLGGFIALRFAPQSLTAPLGSISLISNVIIAPLINKEVLGRWDIAGIFFIVAGSVIVVVFSGIVAQDYKLCVLINLFKKPATIVYLSLIGFFIILTFFFIKFVEKNVENEADMAIGVSAEKALQEEGRLYRMNSNMSNLSLAQKNRLGSSMPGALSSTSLASGAAANAGSKGSEQKHGLREQISEKNNTTSSSGTPLQAPKRLFLQEPGIALNSNISHQTMTSDASDTAVGTASAIGTEPAHDHRRQSFSSSNSSGSRRISVSSLEMGALPRESAPAGSKAAKQGPRLTFDEPQSPGDSQAPFRTGQARVTVDGSDEASRHEGGINRDEGPRPTMSRSQSMTPSVATNHASIRRRRHHRSKDKQDDGKPLTLWQRFKRIEVIPSLPEDKLIRRNSPLLRFCLPLSYAALGGMMASYTVLFAKSLINLLVTSIFDGDNQFTSFLAWVILIVTVVTAVSQVYWINMGLKKYDALLQVPVFFTIWVLLDIIGGGVYYNEFEHFSAKQYVLFCLGVLIVFIGVGMLAKRLALLAKEDVGESRPGSASASRRASVVKDVASAAGTRRPSTVSREGAEEDAGGVGAK